MSDDSPATSGADTGTANGSSGSGSGKKSRKHKKVASHGGAAATAAEGKDGPAPAPAPATPVKRAAADDDKQAPAIVSADTAADGGAAAAVTTTPAAKDKAQRPVTPGTPAGPVDGVEYLLVSELEARERVSPTKKRDKHADALHANRGAVAFPIFAVSWWSHPAAAEVDAAASPSRAAAAATAATAPGANGMLERVLLGGGGGTSGTGVDSGAALCDVVVDEKTNAQSLHVIGRLDTRDALVSGMAIHPLGTEVAMAVGGRTHLFSIRDSATRLHPIASFQTDFTPKLLDQLTSVVRFTPGNGEVLGAAGEDGTVRLWSYPTLRPLCVYQPRHTRSVTAIDFSADGSVCVSTGEGERSCKLWRVPRPKATDAAATAAAMKLPAAADAAAASVDYLLREMKELHKGKALEFRACRFVRAAAPTAGKAAAPAVANAAAAGAGAGSGGDELLLAVLNADPRGPSYVGKWAVPRAADGQSTADAIAAAGAGAWQLLSLVCVDTASPATQLEVSADARRAAVTTAENHLYVYDIGGGADSGTAKALALYSTFLTPMHDLPCTGVAWSGDGRVLLSVSADKSTRFVPIRRTPRRSVLRLLLVNLLAIVLLYAVWRHFTAAATAPSTDRWTATPAAALDAGRSADRSAP